MKRMQTMLGATWFSSVRTSAMLILRLTVLLGLGAAALFSCRFLFEEPTPQPGSNTLSLELQRPFDVHRQNSQWLPAYRCGRHDRMRLVATLSGPPTSALPVQWEASVPIPGDSLAQHLAQRTPQGSNLVDALSFRTLPEATNCPRVWPEGARTLSCEVADLTTLFPQCGDTPEVGWLARIRVGQGDAVMTSLAPGLLMGTAAHLESGCLAALEEAYTLAQQPTESGNESAVQAYTRARIQCVQEGYPDSAVVAWRGEVSLQRRLLTGTAQERFSAAVSSLPLKENAHLLQLSRARALLVQLALDANRMQEALELATSLHRLAEEVGRPELSLEAALSDSLFGLALPDVALAWRAQLELEELTSRMGDAQKELDVRERGMFSRDALGLSEAALQEAAQLFPRVRSLQDSVKGSGRRANTNVGVLLKDIPHGSRGALDALFHSVRPYLETDLSHPDVTAQLQVAQSAVSVRSASLALAQALFLDNYWTFQPEGNHAEMANEALNLAATSLQLRPADIPLAKRWLSEARGLLERDGSVPVMRQAELLELERELALQQKDRSEAEQADARLRSLRQNVKEGEAGNEGIFSIDGEDLLLEARLQELAGDRRGALELLFQAVDLESEAASQAGLAGFAHSYLMRHRAVGDALLEALPLASEAEKATWLSAYHAVHSVRCLPSRSSILDRPVDPSAWSRYLELTQTRADLRRTLAGLRYVDRQEREAERRQVEASWRSAWQAVHRCVEPTPQQHTIDALRESLPSDAEVWVLAALPSHVRGVRIRKTGLETVDVPLEREALVELRAVFVNSEEPPRSLSPRDRSTLEKLTALLPPGRPLSTRLALVLDPFLDGIPIEMLSQAGQPLAERHSISYADSLATLSARRNRGTEDVLRSVTVGVELGVSEETTRSRARALVNALADLGITADVLVGDELTPESLEARVRGATFVQLMVHGASSPFDPLGARLELKNRALTVPELQRLPLQSSVVFLSACQSGPGGVHGAALVQALHAAGARSVVASRWKLPMEWVQIITPAFYQNLKAGMDVASSLRQATLMARGEGEARGLLWLSGDPGW